METKQVDKDNLHEIVDQLPPGGLRELSLFLDYLKFKHKDEPSKNIAVLGGLWKDIDFDVTDADVRTLRREITAQIAEQA